MRLRLILPLFLLACCAALPAGPAAAADDAKLLHSYTPPGWSLAIGLPDYGKVFQPGDPEWGAGADLDWSWQSQIDDTKTVPLYRIDGQTIHLKADDGSEQVLTDADFEAYYDAMLQEWAKDKTFTLLSSQKDYPGAGGRLWHMFQLHEDAKSGPLDYYALLGREDDGLLRMISFYYAPTDDPDTQQAILGMVMLHLDPSLLDLTK